MQSPSEILSNANLTDQQRDVVTATEDFIRVNALAGTGKTYTAVQRVLYQKAIGNEVGHVFTFTRSAAETISKRLVEAGVNDVPVRTLHSYAMEMVNNYREERGLAKIAIPQGQRGSQIIKDLYWKEYEREASDREVEQVRQMSTLLVNGAAYTFRTSESKEELERLVKLYRKEKAKKGQYDWDDLMGFALLTAQKTGQTVAGEIIIDEAQDLTTLQMLFVKSLEPKRLTLILDPNQNIFGFAGVERAATTEKGFTDYTLSKSFRTAQEILDLANQLISEPLVSDISGGKVTWVSSSHEKQVEDVLKLLEPGDCVIGRFRSTARDVLMAIAPETDPEHPVNCKVRINENDYTFGSIHWAKGQEWNRVFILDLTENGFSRLPMTEEEKRILYVAITRAKEEVILMNLTDKKPGWFEIE
jgi:possible ATP-dependent DNA helicase